MRVTILHTAAFSSAVGETGTRDPPIAGSHQQCLTSNVEHGLAGDLAEFVARSQLILAGVLRLHVVDEQHDDSVVVADVVSSRRMDLSSGGRPRQARRGVRFETGLQPTHSVHSP